MNNLENPQNDVDQEQQEQGPKRAKLASMSRFLALLLLLCALSTLPLCAEEARWDQEAAKKRVQAVLDLEEQGRPWDDISWLTSVKKVEEEAKRQNKPVFIFVFLKTDVGPKDATC